MKAELHTNNYNIVVIGGGGVGKSALTIMCVKLHVLNSNGLQVRSEPLRGNV